MSTDQLLDSITGNAGGDPKVYDTKIGPKVGFSVAVTKKYGEDPITRWVQLAVFDERRQDDRDGDLSPWQERVKDTFKKGSKVAAEGIITAKKVDGKTVYDMIVKRIGLVDWVQRGDTGASTRSKRSKAESDDDGEEPTGW